MGFFKSICLLILLLFFAMECSQAAEIKCIYDFGTKEITINTKKTSNFRHIEYLAGIKHTVVVKDFNNFSELDDYLVMENNLGHRITYALNCSK